MKIQKKNLFRIAAVALALFAVVFCQAAAAADGMDFGFSEADGLLPDTAKETLGTQSDKNDVLKLFSLSGILDLLTNGAYSIFKSAFKDFAVIIAVLLILSLVRAASENMSRSGIKTAFNLAAALAVSIVAFDMSKNIIYEAQQAIEQLSVYTKALLPAFAAALAAKGAVSSSAVLPSTVLICANFLTSLLQSVYIPAVNLYFALSLAGAVSDRIESSGIASLIKSAAIWSLTALSTVMTAVLGIQKLVTGAADGVAARTAKLAVGGMVPVVGNIVKDTYETVVGSIKLISSVSGAFAIAAVFYTLLPILLRLGIYSLFFNAAAAFSEMIIGTKTGGFFKSLSNMWSILFAVTVCSGIIFIFSVAVLLTGGA